MQPSNIMINLYSTGESIEVLQTTLIDFRFAYKYKDKSTPDKHILHQKVDKFEGVVTFSSLN